MGIKKDKSDSASTGTDSASSLNSSLGSAGVLPLSASPVGNFYIYSFDGKLLQTYDVLGNLLKDYIYMGDRLVAEYDHVGSRLLYYTPDQINSTRVVTDQAGNVVYWAVHDPYGGIQVTGQNNTYDPQLKFSGKERDVESELDYFGARYYDRSQYRFMSVDAKRPTILNVRAWNLYAYCGNNPVGYLDPEGNSYLVFYAGRQQIELIDSNGNLVGRWDAANNVTWDSKLFPEGTWNACYKHVGLTKAKAAMLPSALSEVWFLTWADTERDLLFMQDN